MYYEKPDEILSLFRNLPVFDSGIVSISAVFTGNGVPAIDHDSRREKNWCMSSSI